MWECCEGRQSKSMGNGKIWPSADAKPLNRSSPNLKRVITSQISTTTKNEAVRIWEQCNTLLTVEHNLNYIIDPLYCLWYHLPICNHVWLFMRCCVSSFKNTHHLWRSDLLNSIRRPIPQYAGFTTTFVHSNKCNSHCSSVIVLLFGTLCI